VLRRDWTARSERATGRRTRHPHRGSRWCAHSPAPTRSACSDARVQAPFQSIAELAQRAGTARRSMQLLAIAGALHA